MKALRLARIMLLAFLTIGFASCDKNNNGNNTDYEIIEYDGEYPAPQNIEYVEDGVTYEIEAIPGQIIISADVDHNTVVNAVKANGGTIIQQYPQYGDYLVEVAVGSENAFITAINNHNITANLNIVEYPAEKFDYFVFDDFIDAAGVQHGKKVSSILSSCQSTSAINEINIYLPKWALGLNIGRFRFSNLLSQNQVLINWSNSYGKSDDDWQSMTPKQKQDFMQGWKMSIEVVIDKILWLKRMSPGIDVVFARAAGNVRCPELAQMINDLKSKKPEYKTVLEENIIFVSDYSTYANTSSMYGDFCFIKEHPYYDPEGGTTSFATPQALCYINQVMKGTIGEDGKTITAVQALAAVKAAIRQNSNGELDLNEALAMARYMYSPNTNSWDGTSWNFSGMVSFSEVGYNYGSYEIECTLIVNSVSNNNILIGFVPEDISPSGYPGWSESFVINENRNLVYNISQMYEGILFYLKVTFVRTGSTTATADIDLYLPYDGFVTGTGLLQGTLTNL